MLSIEEVNGLSPSAFMDAFGFIAEDSPWVAEVALTKRPYADREVMINAFESALLSAKDELQLALIRAHPDLAGKAARAGQVADASRQEQAGAGLDTLSDDEFKRFEALNSAYREAFGFPFIFAVKGATKHMILNAFEARLTHDVNKETQTAIEQICRIFRFRIEDRVRG